MSGGFPLGFDVSAGSDLGANTTSSTGIVFTANATPHAKGAWKTLTASTTYDINVIQLSLQENSYDANAGNISVDLAIGASTAEQVVIPDMLVINTAGSNHGGGVTGVTLPLNIPAGTRIAARCQAQTASETIYLSGVGFSGSYSQSEGLAGYDSIGFISGSTQGSSVVPNASANVKGVYKEMIASTARDYAGIWATFDNLNLKNTGIAGSLERFLIDFAIGADGSEQIIIPNLFVSHNNGYIFAPHHMAFIPVNIPAGTRISARAQSSIADGGTAKSTFGLTIYGGYI
jgi:hypothetical protein